MARIRSIHPNQWTDEAFVTCSPMARLLAIALRNEADDYGVFAWKPLTLKMRLLPADNVDVSALLEELAGADIVRRYEVEGAHYGAIRNFIAFQKPKFPKGTHPRLSWVPKYCGAKAAPVPEDEGSGSEPVGQRYGSGTENPLLMDTETETETDVDMEPEDEHPPPARQPAKPEPKPPKSTKRVRKLADLELDDQLREIAREHGRNPDAELEKFRDWLAARGRRCDDYRAGFRNWLRSDYGKPPPTPGPRASPPRVVDGVPQPDRAEQAALYRRCREQAAAEGLNPHSPEGERRVADLARETLRAAG